MKDVKEEGDVFTVVERNRCPNSGMNLDRKIWREDFLMKPLCRKFLYHEQCLDFEKSMKLAEAMKREDEEVESECCCKRYCVCTNNCEHSVRYMKTGKKESLQVLDMFCCRCPKSICWFIGALIRLIIFLIRMIKSRPVLNSSLNTLDSKICDLLGVTSCGTHDWLAIVLGIGFAFVVALSTFFIYVFIHCHKKNRSRSKISQDNFWVLNTIHLWESVGSFVGSIVGILLSYGLDHLVVSQFGKSFAVKILPAICEFCLILFFSYVSSFILRDHVAFVYIKGKYDKISPTETPGVAETPFTDLNQPGPSTRVIRVERF